MGERVNCRDRPIVTTIADRRRVACKACPAFLFGCLGPQGALLAPQIFEPDLGSRQTAQKREQILRSRLKSEKRPCERQIAGGGLKVEAGSAQPGERHGSTD